MVTTPPNLDSTRLHWVYDLIDPGTKTWKEDIVRSLFFPRDVEEILQISIPSNEGEDFVAWSQEKSGIFSVCSAYKLGAQLKENGNQT
jgi:hypothetical protein